MEIAEYKGSKLLFTSSHLFLFSSLLGFYIGNWTPSIGMLIVYLTSIYYHYNGCIKRKIIDMSSNIILGIYYSYQFYQKNIYLPGIIGLIVFSIYCMIKRINKSVKNDIINHCIFIHIPIYMGFMYLHYVYITSI